MKDWRQVGGVGGGYNSRMDHRRGGEIVESIPKRGEVEVTVLILMGIEAKLFVLRISGSTIDLDHIQTYEVIKFLFDIKKTLIG